MKSVTINLQGKEYKSDCLTDLEASFLGSIFVPMGSGGKQFTQTDSLNAIATLGRPTIKAAIAHTLKEIFPGLPDDLVDYRLYRLPDGREEEKFVMKLSVGELTEIIQSVTMACLVDVKPLAEAIQRRNGNLEVPRKKKKKGFARA